MRVIMPGYKNHVCTMVLMIFFLMTSHVFSENGTVETRYPVLDRGDVILNIPGSSVSEIGKPTENLESVIMIKPKTGDEYLVLISMILRKDKESTYYSDPVTLNIITRDADALKDKVVEKELIIEKLEGKFFNTYYFFGTDHSPKPGEYPYLIRAGAGMGDNFIDVTILHRTKDSVAIKGIMKMLSDINRAK